jgi:hypothetical protein
MPAADDQMKSSLDELVSSWKNSPYPSIKHTSYFSAYVELFGHLRGTECTFIETGVLDGGSLYTWRKWLGDKARIIGLDLNPESLKWQDHGFEIVIGDQGDPLFWRKALAKIGKFDALLDDGGHQSFQQIITAYEAIGAAQNKCVVVIEDTAASFMRDFSRHGRNTFLEFSKDATDVLIGKSVDMYPGRFPSTLNTASIEHFKNVYCIQFFNGIVAFRVDPDLSFKPEIIRNMPPNSASDFRYEGTESAVVDWPNPFKKRLVVVKGGLTYASKLKKIKSLVGRLIK